MNTLYILPAFLMEGTAPAGGAIASGWTTIGMLAIVGVVFYFFLYRPQKKQDNQIAAMRNGLQIGDEITTTGGIIGKIVSIKDETVLLETGSDKTRIRILRSAVRSVDVKAEDAQ